MRWWRAISGSGVALAAAWGCVGEDPPPFSETPSANDGGGQTGIDGGSRPNDGGVEEVGDAKSDVTAPITYCSAFPLAAICEDFERGVPPPSWRLQDANYGTVESVRGFNSEKALRIGGAVSAGAPPGGPAITREFEIGATTTKLTLSLRFRVDASTPSTVTIARLNNSGPNLDVRLESGKVLVGYASSLDFESLKPLVEWHDLTVVLDATASVSWSIDGVNGGTFPKPDLPRSAKSLTVGAFLTSSPDSGVGLPTIAFDNIVVRLE